MRNRILKIAAIIICAISTMLGQAKQPRPKSQKEVDAINQMIGAQDADGRIKAAKDLITNFADTEFKEMAIGVNGGQPTTNTGFTIRRLVSHD